MFGAIVFGTFVTLLVVAIFDEGTPFRRAAVVVLVSTKIVAAAHVIVTITLGTLHHEAPATSGVARRASFDRSALLTKHGAAETIL